MGKEIKALRTQNSLREWSALVPDCRGSGMTVKAWCAEHGVTYSQYYRWQRKVYEAMQEPEFVEITAPASEEPSPAVSVKPRNTSIRAVTIWKEPREKTRSARPLPCYKGLTPRSSSQSSPIHYIQPRRVNKARTRRDSFEARLAYAEFAIVRYCGLTLTYRISTILLLFILLVMTTEWRDEMLKEFEALVSLLEDQ